MSGEVKPINPLAGDENLKAWQQAVAPREKTFTLNGVEVVVRYKVLDILELLAHDNVDNPVLGKLIGSVQQGGGEGVGRDPAAIAQIAAKIKPIMVDIIIDPPLIEQGHQHGVSVSQIPPGVKLEIFMDLIGGDQLGAAETFRREQKKSMVAR